MEIKTFVKHSTLVAVFLVSSIVSAQDKLPFVGTKEFDFDGGALTVQNITIKADGSTILKSIASNGTKQHYVVAFKGKFSNPIQLNDGTGLLFKNNKVFRLDHGKVDSTCSDVQSGQDNIPCQSDLN